MGKSVRPYQNTKKQNSKKGWECGSGSRALTQQVQSSVPPEKKKER
jgi:hypothetical protein